MAYDSLESYVQKNVYKQIYDAIEYHTAVNGYVGTDYINSANAYLTRYITEYRRKNVILDVKMGEITVHSVKCKKISENDCKGINETSGIIYLYSCNDNYYRYCGGDDFSNIGRLKDDIDVNNLISMEICVSADIYYTAPNLNFDKLIYTTDERKFSITFLAELLDGLNIIGGLNTEEIYGNEIKPVSITDTYLLPDIDPYDLEGIAIDIYKKYYYQYYKKDFNFPYKGFIQDQGLKQIIVDFKDSNIFGRMYFKSAEVDDIISIDGGPEISAPLSVSEGTILISRTRYFMEDYGSLYNTVAHELVHWLLHKDFFKILCLLADKPAELSCDINPGQLNDNMTGVQKAIWWAEWQANSLATHITMPKKEFINILTVCCYFSAVIGPLNNENILEHAICGTAEVFGVSKYAAKDRAIQLGILEAEGTLLFHNGEHIPPISFNRNALKMNQTFIIFENEFTIHLKENPELANLIKQKEYVFAECVVVKNDPMYVESSSNGNYTLTKYAREHADECCLIFTRPYEEDYSFGYDYNGSYLSSKSNSIGFKNTEDRKHIKIKRSAVTAQHCTKYRNDGNNYIKKYTSLTTSFVGTLTQLMEFNIGNVTSDDNKTENPTPVTRQTLSDKSGVSERTLRKIFNDPKYKPELKTICALCIGLKLPPLFSRDLLRKAKVGFPDTSDGYFQERILETFYRKSIGEINKILEDNGISVWSNSGKPKKTRKK